MDNNWKHNNKQTEQVIADLQALKVIGTKARKVKSALIRYYQSNSKRMRYKNYKEKGWLIGSGAIEAAHQCCTTTIKTIRATMVKKGRSANC